MTLTKEFVDETGVALLEHCPTASASPEAVERIKAKILGYDTTIGPPSLNVVLAWGRIEERNIQAAIDAENSAYDNARAKITDRKKEIADYVAPASAAREEIIRERMQQTTNQPAAPIPFKPRKKFTDEELEEMDSETYKREIFGIEDSLITARRSTQDFYGVSTDIYKTPQPRGGPRKKTIKLAPEEIASI